MYMHHIVTMCIVWTSPCSNFFKKGEISSGFLKCKSFPETVRRCLKANENIDEVLSHEQINPRETEILNCFELLTC